MGPGERPKKPRQEESKTSKDERRTSTGSGGNTKRVTRALAFGAGLPLGSEAVPVSNSPSQYSGYGDGHYGYSTDYNNNANAYSTNYDDVAYTQPASYNTAWDEQLTVATPTPTASTMGYYEENGVYHDLTGLIREPDEYDGNGNPIWVSDPTIRKAATATGQPAPSTPANWAAILAPSIGGTFLLAAGLKWGQVWLNKRSKKKDEERAQRIRGETSAALYSGGFWETTLPSGEPSSLGAADAPTVGASTTVAQSSKKDKDRKKESSASGSTAVTGPSKPEAAYYKDSGTGGSAAGASAPSSSKTKRHHKNRR